MPFVATVLTMFPEAFPGPLGVSLIGTAWREAQLWRLETVDIRGFSKDKRGFLDDTPAGGGPGQVMRADVIASALDSVERRGRPLLYMSARGRPLTQALVKSWASGPGLIVLCGRYEAIDQRLLDRVVDEEISLGDFVLSGGELPAMALMDAVVRQLPGSPSPSRRLRPARTSVSTGTCTAAAGSPTGPGRRRTGRHRLRASTRSGCA